MGQQPPFDLPLLGRGRHGEKVEIVGVLEDLLRHVRVRGRQRTREVGEGLPFPFVQSALDLQDQNIPTPAVFEGGAKVPLSRGTILDPVQDTDIVAPGQFCNELLQNLIVGPSLGQRTHVTEVPRAEPFYSRELSLQILSEAVDNLASPLLSRKPLAQVPADRPIEEDELPVHGKSGLHLGGPDATLELLEEFLVAGRELKAVVFPLPVERFC